MRFECILEAPTASAQKADETSLTYLNKGQLYGVSLVDKMHSDMTYCTTLRIAFHEDSHRKSAATYWNFWLNQQENPRAARAIELDKAGSIGVVAKETKQFDRVTFQWQGRRGAKVMIRFNCLSTDFSRIKGVKGIPLRIHLDTFHALPGSVTGKIIERCYARIKLFRDKGAERKNKDDQRHLEKMWEKQKTKLGLTGVTSEQQQPHLNEFTKLFAPVLQVTAFVEYTLQGDSCDAEEPMIDSDILIPNKRQFSPQTLTSEFHSATTATTLGPNSLELIGVDPTYVPAPRKKKAVLAIYARFHNENVYRAIYLEQLTVADLVAKVTQQLEAKLHSNVEIIHKTKKGLAVKVDDQVIAHLDDEQDMDVQCSFASDTGALTIYLDY
ncbi:CP2 transcription factor-domain-containing protein [Coemansia spiralis]|nr:CP2 transcription factor-domain-containing protein [Coemansia spiralis]